MEKEDGTEVIESEEIAGKPYIKDVIPALTKSVREHATEKKVNQQLRREQQGNKHDQIDKKIAEICNTTEGYNQENQDFDREVYTATEEKNQALIRFDRTGAIIQALKEESVQIQDYGKRIDTSAVALARRVSKLEEEKCNLLNMKKLKEELETKKQNIMKSPEPGLDNNLLKINKELKDSIKSRVLNLKTKTMVKTNNEQLRSKNCELLRKIHEGGEEISKKKQQIQLKRQQIGKNEQELLEKFSLLQQKLKGEIEIRDKLIVEQENVVASKNNVAAQTGRIKSSTEDKRKLLHELNENISVMKGTIANENIIKRQAYETEQQELINIEGNVESVNLENENILKAISEGTRNLTSLKDQQAALSCKLYEKKTELFLYQQSNEAEKVKLDGIRESLSSKTNAFESLKLKICALDKNARDLELEVNQFAAKKAAVKDEIVAEHSERMAVLQKTLNFEKASIELAEYEIDLRTKKIDELTTQTAGFQDQIKWGHVEQDISQKAEQTLINKIEQEERNVSKLSAEIKAKQAQQQMDNMLITLDEPEDANPQSKKIVEIPAPKKKKINEVQDKKQDYKKQDKIETDEIEEPVREIPSGRKSPGILKSPYRQQQLTSQSKKVTFEGLSSTDSSHSVKSMENKDVEDQEMEAMVWDWPSNNDSAIKRKGRLN